MPATRRPPTVSVSVNTIEMILRAQQLWTTVVDGYVNEPSTVRDLP